MKDLLEKYMERISSWQSQVKSGEINKSADFPEDELKEMMSFFSNRESPLNRIHANLDSMLDNRDITEIEAHLEDCWVILNNALKQYK